MGLPVITDWQSTVLFMELIRINYLRQKCPTVVYQKFGLTVIPVDQSQSVASVNVKCPDFLFFLNNLRLKM